MDMTAFFTLHRNLPREGPGSDEATREAIRRLPPLPPSPRIMDIGCGPGKQTLVLAREFNTPVTAVDFHEPYLEQLIRSAADEGLSDLVIARCANMESLDWPEASLDLIWAEGSIYILGFGRGLGMWRPLLRDGGLVAASELTWLTESPPDGAKAFMDEVYPVITTVEGNVAIAAENGFEVFDRFVLPQAAWWDEYLTPLCARADALRAEARSDPALQRVLDEHDMECEMCRRFGESFGYVFYLMQLRS